MKHVFLVGVLLSASLHAQAQTTEHPAVDNVEKPGDRRLASYPTMLDLTFPEFEAAAAKTEIALLPIGAIEEHGPNLPLATDSLLAVAQLADVQKYLRSAGINALVAPPLNIGITNEASDWARDGTYMYPGSLTVSTDAFVGLYVDVLHSLYDNGFRLVFLLSGHYGGRHLKAVARAAEEANRKLKGMKVVALIDSERAKQLGLNLSDSVALIDRGQNFPMLVQLLGSRTDSPAHADGWEVSLMLHYYPSMVRPGYRKLPEAPLSRFFEAGSSGDRSRNPSGAGGLPFTKASATVGKTIADDFTMRIAETIKKVLANRNNPRN